MFRSGFPKVGGTAPVGAILVSWGALISEGAKGGDFKTLGNFKIFKFTLDILELQMKIKKKS